MNIRASGLWSRDQISVRLVDSTFHPDAATTARVEAAWTTACTRPGVHLFDGPLCRLERLDATPEHLHLDVSRCSYKWFMGTNGSDATREPRADAVGTSAALVTADGWLVFGKRSTAVALYPGYAHPFGGTLEPPLDATAVIDPIAEMARELAEEVGITADDLLDLRCIGLGVDPRLQQPELLYLARVRLDRAEVERRLDPEEHSACWTVRAKIDAIDAALRENDLTPVTRMVLERYRELVAVRPTR